MSYDFEENYDSEKDSLLSESDNQSVLSSSKSIDSNKVQHEKLESFELQAILTKLATKIEEEKMENMQYRFQFLEYTQKVVDNCKTLHQLQTEISNISSKMEELKNVNEQPLIREEMNKILNNFSSFGDFQLIIDKLAAEIENEKLNRLEYQAQLRKDVIKTISKTTERQNILPEELEGCKSECDILAENRTAIINLTALVTEIKKQNDVLLKTTNKEVKAKDKEILSLQKKVRELESHVEVKSNIIEMLEQKLIQDF